MANKTNNRRYNKLLSYRNNYYDEGGKINIPSIDPSTLGTLDTSYKVNLNDKLSFKVPVPTNKGGNLKSLIGGIDKGSLIQGATAAIGKGISGGLSSGAGNAITSVGNSLSKILPGKFGVIAGAAGNIIGGLTNLGFGSKENTENVAAINSTINNLNNFKSDANNFDTLSNTWGTTTLGSNFSDDYVGKDGLLSNKMHNKAEALRAQVALANAFATNSLQNNANNITENTMNNLEASYAAFGGNLNTNGANFPTGLTFIDEGGTHESNPHEGVPMGVGPDGKPNLVEEGETIYNNYVFSNRLTVPKAIRSKYKLRGNKDLSFSDAVKQLSKGATERPNDPISQETLHEIMSDLAQTQEGVRETQNVGKQYSHGGILGTLYDGKGRGLQVLNRNNRTPGLNFGDANFNPYNSNGDIDWDIMYDKESPYMKRRQYVLDNWDSDRIKNWLPKYVEAINNYNKDRVGYTPMTVNDITKDIFEKRTFDKDWGGMHTGIYYAGDPTIQRANRYFLRGKDDKGNPTVTPMSITPWEGLNGNGQTFAEAYPTYAFKGKQERPEDKGTIYTDYYYDENKPAVEEKKEEEEKPPIDLGTSNESLRYAPVVGLGVASFTDALGLTNTPDYGEAAMIEAAAKSGSYKPVAWHPIGNKLTYRPFDRDYYVNKLNASAGASRRALANQGNGSGRTMAGILASDYNAQGQLGDLFRKAEEYNLEQRQKVEDFNRATNQANSQGELQADMANQQAYSNARDFNLRGTMAAAEMRQKARLASEQAKSANLSGFLQALGDIGYENKGMNMIRRLAEAGYVPLSVPMQKLYATPSARRKLTSNSKG